VSPGDGQALIDRQECLSYFNPFVLAQRFAAAEHSPACEKRVALRFPPHSKTQVRSCERGGF